MAEGRPWNVPGQRTGEQKQHLPLLEVRGLRHYFKLNKNHTVKAVDGVSFSIYPGETFGLVGESGSGKSTIGRCLVGLYRPTAGDIKFDGVHMTDRMTADEREFLHRKMQMIFQDSEASLNPKKKVMDLVAQGLDIHHLCKSREEREKFVFRMLELAGLSSEHAGRYPHQFSGGQRQRIGIARALIMNPELIIADEAISALDTSIQAQMVNLMKEIQEKTGTAFLFISHDLPMVRYISDRVGVLHSGCLVEMGATQEIFERPVHPYTRSLLSAIVRPNPLIRRNREEERGALGIDYQAGTWHDLGGGHGVLGTDREIREYLDGSQV